MVENMKKTTLPVLALQKSDGQFVIKTHACDRQTEYVLPQEEELRDIRPVEYRNWAQNDVKKTYETTLKKCMSVVWSVLMLWPYVERIRCEVRADYKSLKCTLDLK